MWARGAGWVPNIYGLISKCSWKNSAILDSRNHQETICSPLSKTYYNIAAGPSLRLTEKFTVSANQGMNNFLSANQSFTFIGDRLKRSFLKHTPSKHPNSDNQRQQCSSCCFRI